MSDPFIGEIKMFGGNFAPRGFALCNGQLLQVFQNEALFSLLGTIYGGDGRTTFGLPDFRGRLPIHRGSGPGLSPANIGEKAGSETVAIVADQLPSHSHTPRVDPGFGTSPDPGGKVPALSPAVSYVSGTPDQLLSDQAVGSSTTGSGNGHNNVMPHLCVNFIIALNGIFPSRS